VTHTAAQTLWCAYASVGPVEAQLRRVVADGLELVGDDEVAVVVGEVPEADFAAEVLAERLNDRTWLERAVSDHDAVMRRLLAVATVVPLRFGSLHNDLASVDEFLSEHRAEFLDTLERVRGRVELGVKVWVAPPAAEAGEQPVTGRGYLERQRKARDDEARSRANIDERLRLIHTRLLEVSVAGVLNRPQPRELTGERREMAMNAAYLVPAADDAFVAEVERLRGAHPDVVLEVTGPWAPYNFVGSQEA
jgi:Gas vesicle synthesis protein GvpL/GvpF